MDCLAIICFVFQQCKFDLYGICEQAKGSADSWIATLGELLTTFASERTIDLGVFESRSGLRDSLLQVRTTLTPTNYPIAIPKRGAKANAKANTGGSSLNCCWTSHVPDEASYLHQAIITQIYGNRAAQSESTQQSAVPISSAAQPRGAAAAAGSAQQHFVLAAIAPGPAAHAHSSASPPAAKRTKVTRVAKYREAFFERTSTLLDGKAPAGIWMAGSSKLDAFLDSSSASDREKQSAERDRKGAAPARESSGSTFLPRRVSHASSSVSSFGRSDSFSRPGAFNRTASIGGPASAAGGTKMIELNEVEALALAKRGGSAKRRAAEEQQQQQQTDATASGKKDGAVASEQETDAEKNKGKKSVSKKSKVDAAPTSTVKQPEANNAPSQNTKMLSLTVSCTQCFLTLCVA